MTQDELAALLARLDEIEARAAAATPGPWKLIEEPYRGRTASREGGWLGQIVGVGSGSVVYRGPDSFEAVESRHDADFIAAARTDVPALVAAVRTLQDRLLAIARHAARLSKRDDLDDEEAIEKLLQVCSDCETWQSECARCAEATGKAADDYLRNEEKAEKALARAEKAEAEVAALRRVAQV